MEKVNRWREAVKATANLSGWDVPRTASGLEAACIKQIVQTILSYTVSLPPANLIGMESRIRHVKSLLGEGSGNVCMIGIWGMGGIGKTTIVRDVYRQISYKFEGSCFVGNVRENSSDNRGLKSLQEKLLSEILMQKKYKVKDFDDGISQIQRRLSRKKVLLVLDDVDDRKQLKYLAGASVWFGPGSRIMVTTRDEHLLCYAQEKYTPELLRETEAMMLFCRHAFKANIPPKEYEKLSSIVVCHTNHLPLALEVLGSYFADRSLDFWQSALKVLAKLPNEEINGILKISYDGLNILEKKIFLHIACFFKGKERRYITRILDSCGFEAVSGITVLIQKSLLTISKGTLHMHDLIQEMGRCLARERYPNNMVWVPEELEEVMATIDRLKIVEAIAIEEIPHTYRAENDESSIPMPSCCSAEVLKSMKKLRLLKVEGQFTSSEPAYFPEQLRWLSWSWYPFQSLGITTGLTKLVGLEMPYLMKQLQIENKIILPNLKFMDLSHSWEINSFPDVSGVPNLERLNLSYTSLVEVHQSVLFHERIIHLDLSSCFSLQILPSYIQMKSLQTLLLNNCYSLERFPEVSTEMGSLLLLSISGCHRIRALPSSISLLTGLIILTTLRCMELETEIDQSSSKRKLPHHLIQDSTQLSSLRVLDLYHNLLVDDDLPSNLYNVWPSLEELNLGFNRITRLPANIHHLSHLKCLSLRYCTSLKELPELPSLIQVLRTEHCTSLQKIGDLSNENKWLFSISLRDCPEVLKDEESESHVANLLMKSFVQRCAAVNHRLSIAIPGTKIPNWFSNQRLGDKIKLNLPQNQMTQMIGLAICCLICLPGSYIHACLKIKFIPLGEEKLINKPTCSTKSAELMWMGYMSIDFLRNLCHGFESEDLVMSFESIHDVVECGVCAVYQDDIKLVTGLGSRIPDYDELGQIDQYNASNGDLQHGRWSFSTFSFDNEKTGDHKSVEVSF